MYTFRFNFLVIFALLVVLTHNPYPTHAQSQHYQQQQHAAQEKPLIVIRFKEPYVQYQRALSVAIPKALAAKPTMLFDVLTVIPQAYANQQNPQVHQAAATYTQQVVSSLGQMGVPPQQIQTRRAYSPYVQAIEVQIFVR